jgi:hypothetical protein
MVSAVNTLLPKRGRDEAGMKDYDLLIARLRRQIAEATEQLKKLEAERAAYEEQRRRRSAYLSSREILDLLAARHGRMGSMATIKRWADEGHLGAVIDEREAFPLLTGKQGNKRFLYPREDVFRFLYEKGLLTPAYDVLDRVRITRGTQQEWAVVISAELAVDRFLYTVQVESSGEVVSGIPEADLLPPEHPASRLPVS